MTSTPRPGPQPLNAAQRSLIAADFRERAGAAADLMTCWSLSQVRRARKLTIDEVAERMGCSADDVILQVESSSADPTLSTLRRYAMAVGAVLHRDVLDERLEPELGSITEDPATQEGRSHG